MPKYKFQLLLKDLIDYDTDINFLSYNNWENTIIQNYFLWNKFITIYILLKWNDTTTLMIDV